MNKEYDPDSRVEEAQVKYSRLYTYSDYLKWDDDKRRELIDGVPYLMSAPGRRHQIVSRTLLVQFVNILHGKPCKVYHAPFDVRLNADTLDNTVVQPDILVVCDSSKLSEAGCIGAPDLVVEILSPSTSRYDRIIKFKTYLKSGVREFWIIDPKLCILEVHILKGNNYITYPYTNNDIVPVHVLEGCSIDLSEVFEEIGALEDD